jgi:hypothetical protein
LRAEARQGFWRTEADARVHGILWVRFEGTVALAFPRNARIRLGACSVVLTLEEPEAHYGEAGSIGLALEAGFRFRIAAVRGRGIGERAVVAVFACVAAPSWSRAVTSTTPVTSTARISTSARSAAHYRAAVASRTTFARAATDRRRAAHRFARRTSVVGATGHRRTAHAAVASVVVAAAARGLTGATGLAAAVVTSFARIAPIRYLVTVVVAAHGYEKTRAQDSDYAKLS